MTTKTNKFSLTRKEAADMLGVSTRTLDRYIRTKKLSSRKKGGAVLLNEEEIQNLNVAKFQTIHGATPAGPGRVHRHVNSTASAPTVIDGDTGKVEEQTVAVTTSSTAIEAKSTVSAREEVFEELYDLSRREVREVNNKLQSANYRLGQLETQLKHSVPLLDYQEKTEGLKEQEMIVNGKVRRQEEALDMLEQDLKSERLNKNIYIGLLFGLLALQPLLWLLLQS